MMYTYQVEGCHETESAALTKAVEILVSNVNQVYVYQGTDYFTFNRNNVTPINLYVFPHCLE